MPEVWMKYGTTDVSLDIKFTNLLANASVDLPLLSDEAIVSSLNEISVSDDMVITALSKSKSVDKVIQMLQHLANSKGFQGVGLQAEPATPGGKCIEPSDKSPSGSAFLLNKECKNTIFISHTSYDPLFGFSGTPTLLLRKYMHDQMLAAFESRQTNFPRPGVECPPLGVALSSSEKLSASSVEIVANSSGISGIYSGRISTAFKDAARHLVSSTRFEVERPKSAIVGGSSESDLSNLTSSLNLLWNSLPILRENGSIILVAENADGLGHGALQMFVEGKLKSGDVGKKGFYLPGLEHLLFLESIRDRYDIGILSTLPEYYLRVLGFERYAGGKRVMENLIAKHGKNHKVLVSSEADVTLLKPREKGER
jgi:hypothetical protein